MCWRFYDLSAALSPKRRDSEKKMLLEVQVG